MFFGAILEEVIANFVYNDIIIMYRLNLAQAKNNITYQLLMTVSVSCMS